ncbi:MAG: TonB-dependent receptor plug domain-containing protein [Elusimicrobiota bacterium]
MPRHRPRAALPVFLLATALMAGAAARAAAEDKEADYFKFMEDEAKAVTVASARPENVFNSVSNVTVIDRDTIDRYNFENVSDALQTVAGVMITRTYSMQHIPTFRGALEEHYANKVLVMIENVPAWNAVTGEGDIDRVGIDSVERIEILRGPASVLYGSNALNGAINIVLRRPQKNSKLGLVGAGVGNGHDGFGGTAQVSHAAGLYSQAKENSSLFFSADYNNQREPAFAFTDETRAAYQLQEYYTVRNVNAQWKNGGHSLLANVSNSLQDYGGNNISLATGGQNPAEKEMELLNYAYSFGPNWSNLKYSATYDRQRRQIPRDEGDGLRSDILGARYVNALTADFDLPGPFTLELGGEHEYRVDSRYNNFISTSQTVVSENGMRNRVVWEGSVFAQVGYDQNPWKLAAGTRYTHNEQFGDDFSSRGSAVYMINEKNSVKFMAGQSFRAPTPFELYFLNNPVTIVGNPDLRPEKTFSTELSYLTQIERVFGQATVYYEEYTNSIFRNLGGFNRDGQSFSGVNFYDNAPRYHAKGAELELRYAEPRLAAFTSFDYILGSQGDAHAIAAPGVFGLPGAQSYNFKYVPRYSLSSGVSGNAPNPFGPGEFFGSLVANHFSSMDTLRTRLPDQAWADASVGFKNGAFKHTLSLHNVTGSAVAVPEYVRQRVVESMPLVNGRRVDYTVAYRF